jgi:lipoprotein-releasing system permease protein
LVSLPFARNLFGYKTEFSALELSVPLKENIPLVKTRIEKLLGKSFKVKDQYEQKESIYKIFESEKLAIFAILSFIMLIAAFNMAGALTMLIIEKEKDIIILRNIGLTDHKIKQVFLSVGMIIALIGCVSGLIIGGVTCWLQMQFGFIKLENSVVDYYPVTIRAFDFIIVSVIATIIGALTSWIPVRKLNAGIKFDV